MPVGGARRKGCGRGRARLDACQNVRMEPRFLKLSDVQEILNISSPQAYALVRSGELPAIQVGGRGVWRVERTELEAYIARQYEATRAHATAREETR